MMKKPILILTAVLAALLLFPAIGLPLWAAHKADISAIPESGTYVCEELSMSLTFGDTTTLVLPDGTQIEVAIDYGLRVTPLAQDDRSVIGWYAARLKNGCVELRFETLPIPFEPDHTYRFEKG